MPLDRDVLTPEALSMMDVIARTGSFAAAARELGKVPSSLTYSVRQLEDALDVLLFDRSSRQARLTAAGDELLQEGRRLLAQMDAVANRVRRIATGWESQLSVAIDDVISRVTMLELCEAFYAIDPQDKPPTSRRPSKRGAIAPSPGPGSGTRLKVRTEVLAGTWEALVSGQADLAIGVGTGRETMAGVQVHELGALDFVFAVAPHHPLAAAAAPISDLELMQHRAIAVADSAQRLAPLTVNLLPGQDVLTMSSMGAKIAALVRGLGCGFVPEPLAREHIAAGRLAVKAVQRPPVRVVLGYAWRRPIDAATPEPGKAEPALGRALQWWLDRLASPATRRALLERHIGAAS